MQYYIAIKLKHNKRRRYVNVCTSKHLDGTEKKIEEYHKVQMMYK